MDPKKRFEYLCSDIMTNEYMRNGSMRCIFAIPGRYGSFWQAAGGSPLLDPLPPSPGPPPPPLKQRPAPPPPPPLSDG